MTRAEAAQFAQGNPVSFLHVGRSDIDLPASVDPHDDRVYTTARDNLDRFRREGTLRQDPAPGLYLYELQLEGRAQIGVVGCVHIDDYEQDLIRKHERTRPDKEDDRTRHVLTLEANAEPVFLAYRGVPGIDALVARERCKTPEYDFTVDGVRHRVWLVDDPAALVGAFGAVPVAYVADGHHRSASAWRAGRDLRAGNPGHTGQEEYNWFLAVLFPADQLGILAYNRVVADLGGRTPAEFLAALAGVGRVEPTDEPSPPAPGAFGIYLDGTWYRLQLDPSTIDWSHPIASLDAALLQERLLAPLLGIIDARTDPRLDFVGGIRGTDDLARRVDAGEAACAIALHPTTMEQLLAVSDAGAIMPPKSTWFEPKLKSGLFVHALD